MIETSMDLRSKISTKIDFRADGVQHGHLTIPHSRNESAWGSILMPVSVFQNSKGPTVLLTGGSHGDEYEGPIALMNLMRSLDIGRISGRVIVIPALNYHGAENRAAPPHRNLVSQLRWLPIYHRAAGPA
jgi:N-alpha-acetyl-L-2,4-diaminobutyrate deacetylase